MGNSDKNTVRPQNKNLRPPMKKGETLNPNGRPKGQRNYAVIYREALKNIAKANDKTPEEIEEMLEVTGLKKALKGDFNFWKDVRDRVHGKAPQTFDVNAKIQDTTFTDEEKQKLLDLI